MSTTVQIHPTPSKGQSDPGMVAFIPTNENSSERTQNNDDDFITTPERKTDRQRKKTLTRMVSKHHVLNQQRSDRMISKKTSHIATKFDRKLISSSGRIWN